MDRLTTLKHPIPLALVIILMLLLIRIWFLSAVPLYDTTEARYAEIARIMHETNNWITPQFDYQQPFWGKPPGHTWLSAASFSTFGVSAFSARFPHFLCGLLVLALLYQFARQQKNVSSAILSCLVMTSSLGFIVAMGMVMTDIALLLSITLGMTSYWKAYSTGDKFFHGHLFFASLALGMLIKGPVALVLVGIALFGWSIWQKNLKRALSALPWASGIGLFLLLTLPWYLMAESRTPGFLQYFIIGEHIQRFLVSGWEGDLYGSAHDKPRGTIWLFWLATAFPWSFLLIGKLFKHYVVSSGEKQQQTNSLMPYLICWMLAPMLLFTLAGNILIAYVLPGFSAMAILTGLHTKLNGKSLCMAGTSLLLVCSVMVAHKTNAITKTSEVELLGTSPTQYANNPLYYWKKRPFSASFYSRGQARLVDNEQELMEMVKHPDGIYFAAQNSEFMTLYPIIRNHCTEQHRTKSRFLMFCRSN